MKVKEYTLRKFLKRYANRKTGSFIYYYKNQNQHAQMPSVQYSLQFSSVKSVAQSVQNDIEFYNDNGDFLIINNVYRIKVKEKIIGFGTPIIVVCSDGIIHSTSNRYCYEIIMR